MSDCHKVRFVVGVFHSATRLMSACETLRRNGIASEDVVLLGCPGAFEDELSVATGGFLAGSVGAQDGKPPDGGNVLKQQVADFENWVSAPHAQGLRTHLARGACLLFVSAPLSDQERRIGEIFLRASAESVQSHEFSMKQ